MESSVLVKAFALLETLGSAQTPMTLAALAEQCGLAKPTAHRVLNDLASLGYVDRIDTGVYRLTQKLHRLATGTGQDRLIAAADPILEQLHRQTGETVNLGVLRRNSVVYLRVLESKHPLRRVGEAGTIDPFYSTALGRAIVSQMPEESWGRLLRQTRLESRTSHTVTDLAQLRQRLREAGRQGFAVEIDENDVGVMCVGAPVFDNGGVVGAVSLSAPSARVDETTHENFVQAVCEAADQLTETLKTQG